MEGREREPWSAAQVALAGVAVILAVAIAALGAFGLGIVRMRGEPSPTPLSIATSTESPAPSHLDSATALCSAFTTVWDLQNNHAVPIANRFMTWMGSPGATLDTAAMYADARAIGVGSVQAGTLVQDIIFPEDPSLLVDLKTAIADYAQGSVALKKWLDAGPENDLTGSLDGLQLIDDGRMALTAANVGVGAMHASGVLPCDALY